MCLKPKLTFLSIIILLIFLFCFIPFVLNADDDRNGKKIAKKEESSNNENHRDMERRERGRSRSRGRNEKGDHKKDYTSRDIIRGSNIKDERSNQRRSRSREGVISRSKSRERSSRDQQANANRARDRDASRRSRSRGHSAERSRRSGSRTRDEVKKASRYSSLEREDRVKLASNDLKNMPILNKMDDLPQTKTSKSQTYETSGTHKIKDSENTTTSNLADTNEKYVRNSAATVPLRYMRKDDESSISQRVRSASRSNSRSKSGRSSSSGRRLRSNSVGGNRRRHGGESIGEHVRLRVHFDPNIRVIEPMSNGNGNKKKMERKASIKISNYTPILDSSSKDNNNSLSANSTILLLDTSAVVEDMNNIIKEMAKNAAECELNAEHTVNEDEKSEYREFSSDSFETAKVAFAYKNIIDICYPKLKLKYEQKLDDNVKNENALKILSRQVGSKNVELVDRYLKEKYRYDLAKDVHCVKEPKLKKLVPKMKEAQQQLSTLSELITQPGNDISEIMSRLKLKEKDVSRLEEYVQAEQEIVKEYRGKKEDYFEKMKELEKEIINSDSKTLMEYFQLSKKKQNLHEAVLDLKSALGQIAIDRDYVYRAKDLVTHDRRGDILFRRRTRMKNVSDYGDLKDTEEEMIKKERSKRDFDFMVVDIMNSQSNYYSQFMKDLLTENRKEFVEKEMKRLFNSEYKKKVEEQAEISQTRESGSLSYSSKSQSTRTQRKN